MSSTMTFLKRIMNVLTDARERNAQKHTRRYLLGLSDRNLEDMGFSRELLEQGLNGWPWRTAEEPLGVPGLSTAMRQRNTDNGAQPANDDRGHRDIGQAVGFNRPDSDRKLAA